MSRCKYDNGFKQKVIENKVDKTIAREKRIKYKESFALICDEDGELFNTCINGNYYDFLEYCRNVPTLDCALRINESKARKSAKVRQKIRDLVLSHNAVFVTLTFKDSVFETTTYETRRRYVARFLKMNCKRYAANIDYGEDERYTHREHYHAVVEGSIDFSGWYKYGGINAQRVDKQSRTKKGKTLEDDLKATSKYIAKLSNHALKVGINAPRLIYSRDTL